MITHLFDRECSISRDVETLGQYNRASSEPQKIGTYPCLIERLSSRIRESDNANKVNATYDIYLPPNADVKEGDLVEIDEGNFNLVLPTKYRTHIEAELALVEEEA